MLLLTVFSIRKFITHKGPPSFIEYQVGSGVIVSVKDFVKAVIAICHSNTLPNFSALPYCKNEVMESIADISGLSTLGWELEVGLFEGIKKSIIDERMKY